MHSDTFPRPLLHLGHKVKNHESGAWGDCSIPSQEEFFHVLIESLTLSPYHLTSCNLRSGSIRSCSPGKAPVLVLTDFGKDFERCFTLPWQYHCGCERKVVKTVRVCRPSQIENFSFFWILFNPTEVCAWPLCAMFKSQKSVMKLGDLQSHPLSQDSRFPLTLSYIFLLFHSTYLFLTYYGTSLFNMLLLAVFPC